MTGLKFTSIKNVHKAKEEGQESLFCTTAGQWISQPTHVNPALQHSHPHTFQYQNNA